MRHRAPKILSAAPIAVLDRVQQPGAGVGPVPVSGPPGHAEHLGGFLLGQAGEEAELDELGALGLLGGEPSHRLIEGEQVESVGVVPEIHAVEGDPEEAAEVLGVSRRTADRYWAYARAWLLHAIEDRDGGG